MMIMVMVVMIVGWLRWCDDDVYNYDDDNDGDFDDDGTEDISAH